MASWTYTRSSFAAVAAGSSKTRGSSRPEMPTKPHTRWPGSICTTKVNAGRLGYASEGLGAEARRRSCFTPLRQPAKFVRYRLTFNDAVDIWLRHWAGEYQHTIAARYDVS